MTKDLGKRINRGRNFLGKIVGLAGLVITSTLFLDGCATQTSIIKQEEPWFRGVVCNYWQDKNGDGAVDRDEFIGVKDIFRAHENITIMAYVNGKKGAELTTQILNGEGKLVGEYESILPYVDTYNHSSFAPGEIYNKGGVGEYTVKWYINDNLVGIKEFNLIK